MNQLIKSRSFWLFSGLILFGFSAIVYAFVSLSVNISKENAYTVFGPKTSSATTSKENNFVILGPLTTKGNISKFNVYTVLSLTPISQSVNISKYNAYLVVIPGAEQGSTWLVE